MLYALLRVLFAYAVACLVAAAIQVAYAYGPADSRLGGAGIGELVLMTATHFAIFAAPFAFVVAAVGEWQGIRSWAYYAGSGVAIAAAGFLAQYASESGGPSVLNEYALKAFLTPGFASGFVYWMVSGRRAGGEDASSVGESATTTAASRPLAALAAASVVGSVGSEAPIKPDGTLAAARPAPEGRSESSLSSGERKPRDSKGDESQTPSGTEKA